MKNIERKAITEIQKRLEETRIDKKEINEIGKEFYSIIGIVDNPMNRCVDLVTIKYSSLLSRLDDLDADIIGTRSVKKINKKMADWVVAGVLKRYEDLCNQHGAGYETRLKSLTRIVNTYYNSLLYDDTNDVNKKLAPVDKLLFPGR